jgi:hypothetical protein
MGKHRRRILARAPSTLPAPSPRLLRLAFRCPICGADPPFQVVDTEVARFRDSSPDQIVGIIKCGWEFADGRVCRHHYLLPAHAIQRAS